MRQIHNDTVLGAAVTLLSIAGICYAATLGEGPRVFPLMVLIPAVILGPIIMLRGQRKLRDNGENPHFFTSFPRFFMLLVLLILLILGVQEIGFFTTTVVLIPVIAWTLGYRKPLPLAITTIGFLGFIHILFIEIFSRPLPPEIWSKLWS